MGLLLNPVRTYLSTKLLSLWTLRFIGAGVRAELIESDLDQTDQTYLAWKYRQSTTVNQCQTTLIRKLIRRSTSCPDLDYGTSVHFTSPSGWQRLAQASVPNSIPPEGLQAMVGSIFSPQPITFTQNDLPDIRYPHTRPLYVEALVDHYQIKRVLMDTGAGLNICTLSTARLLNFDPSALHYSCSCI